MGTGSGSDRRALGVVALLALSVGALTASCQEQRDKASASAEAEDKGGRRIVGASAATELTPFGVGQWVRYTVRYSNGHRGQLTYKVVDREQDAWWVEVVTGAPNAGTVLQLLMATGSRRRLDDTRVLAARISMPNGIVRELRGVMLEPSRAGYTKTLSPLFVASLTGSPQESVTGPAGSFEGCYRLDQRLVFGELDGPSTVWIHPSVPLTGLVRATPKSGEASIELESFEMRGAQSSMKPRGSGG